MRRFLLLPIMLIAIVMCTACSGSEEEQVYGEITKAGDKLYEVTYDEYEENEEAVAELMATKFKGESAGCTSIYKDGMLLRNLDWYISENNLDVCELVMKTTANEGRYATVAVSNNSLITEDNLDKLTDEQKMLIPFSITDGLNSEGLMYSQNVCPDCDGVSYTCGTNPDGKDLINYMVGRQLLDHCADVDEAIEYLKNSNVYLKDNGDGTRMETHFMVADKDRAVIIEFVDNKMVVLEQEDLPYEETFMTNHYLYNGGENTGHGMGYHRDEIVKANYDSVEDWKSGMDLLEKLRYTQAYTLPLGDDFWYDEYYVKTEFNGKTVDFNSSTANDDPEFLEFIADKQKKYENGEGAECWWTNHSSVYDSESGTLHLVIREQFDNVYTFELEK